MTVVPSPVAMWDEHPDKGAALALTGLYPYKTTDGYWVLVPRGSQPVGATQGAAVRGATYDTLTTSAITGLRHARGPTGFVFSL